MDADSDHGSAAKGPAKDLEVAGSGPVSCRFSIPSSFFTMCSSQVVFHLHCHGTQTISINAGLTSI